jgi:phage terminase large subunit-like protein
VYLACFFDYRRRLSPGERATVLIIATNSKQARVIFRYVRALLTHVPMLAKLVQRATAHSFDLDNDTTIEVHPASYRTTRGYTIVAALCDEIDNTAKKQRGRPDTDASTRRAGETVKLLAILQKSPALGSFCQNLGRDCINGHDTNHKWKYKN